MKGDLTHLTLIILEGRTLKTARSTCTVVFFCALSTHELLDTASVLSAHNYPLQSATKYSDTLRHDDNNEVVADIKIIVLDQANHSSKIGEITETVCHKK